MRWYSPFVPATLRTNPFTITRLEMAKVALDMQKVKLIFFDAAIAGLGIGLMTQFKVPLPWMVPAVLVATLGGRLMRPGRVARKYYQPDMASTFQEKWIELTGDKLRQVSATGIIREGKLKEFSRAIRVRDQYVITEEPGIFFLVPRSSFASDEDRSRFEEAVRKYVKKVVGI